MNNVSVPCRGTAFLNVVSTILMIWLNRFRPLSGNCISQSGIVITIAHGSEVSVPCRGTAFLNTLTINTRGIAEKLVSVPCRGTAFLNSF